jgi:hypothetical protein
MKKLLTVAALTLGLASLVAPRASAGFCCGCFHHCCHDCCATICCKQYNAFTPACFGTICCNGCCPISCGNTCGPMTPGPLGCGAPWGYGGDFGGPYCSGGDCAASLGSLPSTEPYLSATPMTTPAPATATPSYQPPMPTPAGDTSLMTPRPFPQAAIQTAGYYPANYGYGYGYAPTAAAGYNYGYGYGYAPTMPQAAVPYYPAYWNAGR